MEAAKTERFAALDLLRGIAALSVLALHLPWPPAVRPPLLRGYLAVDLFFLLSGFVIAQSYSSRLGTVEEFKQFCLARLIRLYPLYLIATLIAAAEMFVFAPFGNGVDGNASVGRVMGSLAAATLFLPTPARWSVQPPIFFPLVYPAWSLFWELCVNLLHGAARPLLGRSILAMIILIGAAGIGLSIYSYGTLGGPRWEDAWSGGARAVFSYFAGVGIFRIRQAGFRAHAVPAVSLTILLLVVLVPATFGGWPYDLVCVAFLFPLLIWLAADATMGPRLRATGTFVGFLSYPVYILQAPLLLWVAKLPFRADRPGVLELCIGTGVILLGSWFIGRWLDLPTREYFRRRLIPRATMPQAQTAP